MDGNTKSKAHMLDDLRDAMAITVAQMYWAMAKELDK